MIRIAIVEDDEKAAKALQGYIGQYEEETGTKIGTKTYTDGYDIAETYPGGFDIILMDIEMAIMNGMEAAERIRERDQEVIIIFITNMPQYAIQGYRVGALDYVLKPVQYTAFCETLKKALRKCDSREHFLSVPLRDGMRKLPLKEIRYIESHGHRLTFHLDEGECETTVFSMKELEEKLSGDGFARCNSGCLVNLKRVSALHGAEIEIGGEMLPISRGRKAEFTQKLVRAMTQ
ncbi:MAG: LytR/AlgR family response regulator transcription factor [Lachnospiraceae bacterium]